MELAENIGRDEQAILRLRRLFEQRGYKKMTVNEFEEYDLYLDNKSFLETTNIITFMDPRGKVLALKPDVTLSIVKNAARTGSFEKLYYVDKVYRLSTDSMEFKSISQIGLELIGRVDQYSNLEVVTLALQSLRLISGHYLLDISHLGFVSGLLEEREWDSEQLERIFQCIHSKNVHELEGILSQAKIGSAYGDKLLSLCQLGGRLGETIEKARSLVINERMAGALNELEQLKNYLSDSDYEDKVDLDFSAVNDLDYYNGLVFRGYIKGIPNSVLTGGRYDNLMRKLGCEGGALGFAVLPDDLNTYLKGDSAFDADILLTYGDSTDYKAMEKEIGRLNGLGYRVRAERGDALENLQFTYRKQYAFEGTPVDVKE